jgi:mRNA interferase RelE/StbE
MSRYTVYVTPQAWQEIKNLPGNMRQRVRRAVDGLAADPRPARSKQLDVSDIEPVLYRLRLDRWRIVYAISERERVVDVLAVRKRPPYDYGDLEGLIAKVG